MERPDAILIAGPTASGKSKLALEMAELWGGEIVNTDSMQIYPVLNILTARPDEDDLARVPHHLYGFAPLAEPYSVARWLEDARRVSEELWSRDVVPVFVGGTGLYFRALEKGLAGTPDIPAEIRAEIRQNLIEDGSVALHARLTLLDPAGAALLRPSDGQRIARALEVITATGKPLLDFQNQPVSAPFLDGKSVHRTVLMPQRPMLHERINLRTEWMMEQGALDEVTQLLSLKLPDEATVMRAIGVRQLTDYIRGEQLLKNSIDGIKAATRQYAKRQSTWFRGQFSNEWSFSDPFAGEQS